MIVAGHGRWEAAKQLGHAEVPVIGANFLTDADRRAFALAENRLAELSSWDEVLLANGLSILFEGGYDLEITGFSTADLDFALPDTPAAEAEEAVTLPDPGTPSITQPGDLWQIGPHRLYCGIARFAESGAVSETE
jgi:ParB-like chromosome segregation protein Spo0J